MRLRFRVQFKILWRFGRYEVWFWNTNLRFIWFVVQNSKVRKIWGSEFSSSFQVCLHTSMALNFFCDTFACPIALYKSLSLQRKELWKNKWHKLSKQLTCQTKRHWITALINIRCVGGFFPPLQHFDLWFFKHFDTMLLDT